MTGAEQLLYARLVLRMAPRFRWRIWRNFWRYSRTVRRTQRIGSDHLSYTPPNVVIWVTNRCNKDCHFCQYLDDLNAKNHRELELTFDRFKELIHLPIARNSLRLGLYGGEPLLNVALPEMIEYGKRQGHLVTVNTNGLLIKKRLTALLNSPPDLLCISFYPEDRHKTEEAIALTAPHIPVAVNYMYSEARLADVEDVARCAAAHGVWVVRFETYEPQGTHADCELLPPADTLESGTSTTSNARRSNQEISIRPEDPRLAQLQRELHAKYGGRVLMSWPQPMRERRGEAHPSCRTFWHSTWLDAKGQMSPCCVWPASAFEDSVFDGSAAWNSARMIHLRRSMRHNLYSRICSTCSHLYDDQLGL
jgi:MoaA/NifB/PqqE/SkfB family radical SAM enzyme